MFLGSCTLGGVLVAIMGAGHITLITEVSPSLIGPAEPAWLNPTLHPVAAWVAFNWPIYIGAMLIFMGFVLRLPVKTTNP